MSVIEEAFIEAFKGIVLGAETYVDNFSTQVARDMTDAIRVGDYALVEELQDQMEVDAELRMVSATKEGWAQVHRIMNFAFKVGVAAL
jgi:hypothetical protein